MKPIKPLFSWLSLVVAASCAPVESEQPSDMITAAPDTNTTNEVFNDVAEVDLEKRRPWTIDESACYSDQFADHAKDEPIALLKNWLDKNIPGSGREGVGFGYDNVLAFVCFRTGAGSGYSVDANKAMQHINSKCGINKGGWANDKQKKIAYGRTFRGAHNWCTPYGATLNPKPIT